MIESFSHVKVNRLRDAWVQVTLPTLFAKIIQKLGNYIKHANESLWQLSYSSSSRWTLFSFVPDFPCALPGFTCKKSTKEDFFWHFKSFNIGCAISCIKISCMYKKLLNVKNWWQQIFQNLLAGTTNFHTIMAGTTRTECELTINSLQAYSALAPRSLNRQKTEYTKKGKNRANKFNKTKTNNHYFWLFVCGPCFQHSQFTIFRTL